MPYIDLALREIKLGIGGQIDSQVFSYILQLQSMTLCNAEGRTFLVLAKCFIQSNITIHINNQIINIANLVSPPQIADSLR